MPDVDDSSRHGLAGVDVNVLHLEEDIHTIGVKLLFDVLTHNFTPDIVGTVSNSGRQNCASVSAEDD